MYNKISISAILSTGWNAQSPKSYLATIVTRNTKLNTIF